MSKNTKPGFDLRSVGRAWRRELLAIERELQALVRNTKQGDLLDEQAEALSDKMLLHLLQAVPTVPENWLLRNAPPVESIDWSDAACLDHLRADAFEVINAAFRDAMGKN